MRNTLIGSARQRGVSGGERKRVAIGKELISDPIILFLDEPTSGLDSFQAQSVTKTLKHLCSQGKSIVAVIHQPRSSIFEMFDSLLLLSEGRVLYFGLANEALAYFAAHGFLCPGHCNPSDFLLDLVSVDGQTEDSKRESKHRLAGLVRESLHEYPTTISLFSNLHLAFSPHKSTTPKTNIAHESLTSKLEQIRSVGGERTVCCAHLRQWLRDFHMLLWRSSVQIYRDVTTLFIRVGTTLFFAAILSSVFQHLGHSQTNIQDRIGILYFVTSGQVGV